MLNKVKFTCDCSIKNVCGISHMTFKKGVTMKLPYDLGAYVVYNGWAQYVR